MYSRYEALFLEESLIFEEAGLKMSGVRISFAAREDAVHISIGVAYNMNAARVITLPIADRQDLEGSHGKDRQHSQDRRIVMAS